MQRLSRLKVHKRNLYLDTSKLEGKTHAMFL